jgi:hypothetical protein
MQSPSSASHLGEQIEVDQQEVSGNVGGRLDSTVA